MTARTLPIAAAGCRLAELELVVERGIKTFVELGNALREIRDRHLYRYPAARERVLADLICRLEAMRTPSTPRVGA